MSAGKLTAAMPETAPDPAPAASPRTRSLARRAAPVACVVLVVVLFSGPQWLSENGVTLAITLFTLMALAQAWNLIGGYGGQFSIGHGLFVGVGGYATTVVLVRTGLPVALAVLAAGVVCAALGAISAVPLLRLRGVYFSVGTIGVLLAVQAWFINWGFVGQTTGVIMPAKGTLPFVTQYYMTAGLVVVTTGVVWWLVRSRFGLRLMAVRDDEFAAAELGVNGFRVKLVALTVSACLVGLAGAMNAFQQLSLEPYSAFSISWAINMILACVIGGLATVPGPLIGAAVMFELQQLLQGSSDLPPIIEGVVLLVIIRFAPGGIWGLARGALTRLRGWKAARA
ncbi:MAG TPA: branched-chain amino acid ABC transporter permease [Solirubrobacteraceae bacterium]|jgi:branched-chain amino acid transport system permease protein